MIVISSRARAAFWKHKDSWGVEGRTLLLLMAWHVVMTRDIALKCCLWLLPKNGGLLKNDILSLPSFRFRRFNVLWSSRSEEDRWSGFRCCPFGCRIGKEAELGADTPEVRCGKHARASACSPSPTTPLGAAGRRGREEQFGFFKTYNQVVVMKL